MKMRKMGLAAAASLAFCATSLHAADNKEKLTLSLGFESSIESAQGVGAMEMAKVAGELSKGQIEFKLFPNSVLGSGPKMIEMVAKGELDLFHGGAGLFTPLESRLNVFDIPYLFETVEQAYKVMDSPFGGEMLDSLKPHGLKGLAFWENGIRSVTNNRAPITTPEDLVGLKMRVMSGVPVYEKLWQAFGTQTTGMASSAIYEAIKSGKIDSQEHPISVIYARKLYEVQKYLSLTRHLYGPAIQVMNLKKFELLPAEQQQILLKASYAGAVAQRNYSNDNEAQFLEEMKTKGLLVNTVDPRLFKDKVRPTIEKDFVEKNGDEWLKKINASLAAK